MVLQGEYLTVKDVANQLGVSPRLITSLFYNRKLRDDLCPLVAGRRAIPPAYVPEIGRVLRRRVVHVGGGH